MNLEGKPMQSASGLPASASGSGGKATPTVSPAGNVLLEAPYRSYTLRIDGGTTYYHWEKELTGTNLLGNIIPPPRTKDDTSKYCYYPDAAVSDPARPQRSKWEPCGEGMDALDWLRWINPNRKKEPACGPGTLTWDNFPLSVYVNDTQTPPGYAQDAREGMSILNSMVRLTSGKPLLREAQKKPAESRAL